MSDLAEWRPLRVQLRVLREHLQRQGPETLDRLVEVAQFDDQRLTPDMIEATLEAKPHIFQKQGHVYTLAPTVPVTVRHRRLRPARTPQWRRPNATTSRDTPAPPPPPARDWAMSHDGSASAVVPDEAIRHSSGRRLLVELPAAAVVSAGKPPSDTAAVSDSTSLTSVALYQRTRGVPARLVYRGRRDVVDLIHQGSNIVAVLEGPADLDWGREVRSAVPALPVGRGSAGRELALRPTIADVLQAPVDPLVRQAARLSLSRSRAARGPVLRQVQTQLALVRDDTSRWPEFARWVAVNMSKGGRWDQELLEDVLRMSLGVAPALEVARLATELLSGLEPKSVAYAEALAPHLVALDESAREHARACLRRCRERGIDNPDLDVTAGRLAFEEGRYDDACALFRRGLENAGEDVDLDLLRQYVEASSECTDRQQVQRALDRVQAVIDCPSHGADTELSEVLGWAITAACAHGLPWLHLLQAGVRLGLRSGTESTARDEYVTWSSDLRLSERFETLSLFELGEEPATSDWLLQLLLDATDEAWRQPQPALFQRAVAQLACVVTLLGRADEGWVDRYAAELDRRGDEERTEPPNPYQGVAFTLVGGRAAQRRRIAGALIHRGARLVREVAPHWEARVDRQVMRDGCASADVVVLLTDETGHQEQALLRGLDIKFHKSQGGPSRVLYEIGAALAAAS